MAFRINKQRARRADSEWGNETDGPAYVTDSGRMCKLNRLLLKRACPVRVVSDNRIIGNLHRGVVSIGE